MEQKHRNILQTSFVFLTKNIYNVETVCDYLEMDEILTSGMVDEIKHKKPVPTGQVRHLLTILPRRGKKAYESFVAALIKTENIDSSDFLRAKEDPRNSQNSVQPKPRDMSDDVEESTKSHYEKGDNSKKSEGPSHTTKDEGWPDLKKGVKMVQRKDIQVTPEEDLTRISENHNTYHMTGKNKGKLIIISNVPDQCKADCCEPGRQRTSNHDMDFDKTSIQQLFKHMKFEFKAGLQCQTGEELKKSLKEIGEDAESSYDSLVVVILSGGIGYEPGQIYDRNGVRIPRDDVLQIIRDSPAFKGKPKIVIIRTYSFEGRTDIPVINITEVTAPYDTLDAAKAALNISSTPNNDDMFVVSSSPMTKMGPWMIGDNCNGSYFIQAFIHVFKNHAHEKSFLQLIEEVNKLLHTTMVPELIEGKYSDKCTKTHVAEAVVLEYSKEKDLFLFPGKTDIAMKGKEEMKKKEVCGWPVLKNAGNKLNKKEIKMSTPEFHSRKVHSGQQIYHMSGTGIKRGKVIWITNIHSPNMTHENDSVDDVAKKQEKLNSCRNHIDFDKTNMTLLLKEIGFDSKGKDQIKNKTTEEIKQFLTDRLTEVDNDTDIHHDSLIVMMMSGKVGCTSAEIYDKDGNQVPRNEILQILKDSQHFKGKPKIVIIQTYNFQKSTLFDETDSGGEMKVPGEPNPDDLFVVSSYPRIEQGPWMIGEDMNGSYFIQALIHILKNHTHDKSFLELMKEVHKCLLNVDIPEKDKDGKYIDKVEKKHVADVVLLEHSEEKELYFFPGIKLPLPHGQINLASSFKGAPVCSPLD